MFEPYQVRGNKRLWSNCQMFENSHHTYWENKLANRKVLLKFFVLYYSVMVWLQNIENEFRKRVAAQIFLCFYIGSLLALGEDSNPLHSLFKFAPNLAPKKVFLFHSPSKCAFIPPEYLAMEIQINWSELKLLNYTRNCRVCPSNYAEWFDWKM